MARILGAMKHLLAIASFALASCASVTHEQWKLDQTWAGEVHPGVMSTLAFDLDGSARWSFELPAGSEVYELKYELKRESSGPAHLDFTGFTQGPFAGKTLYGIAEWDEKTLRLDANPGDSGKGGDSVRPQTFSDQTRVFKRVH